MRLLLVRHGQTEDNTLRRIQGQSDVPLDSLGHDQGRRLARRLAGEKIHAIYASPLRRAWETAMTVAANHPDVQVLTKDRLKEASYGPWEGLTWAQVRTRFPLNFAEWAIDRDRVPEGAESVQDLAARVESMLGELKALHDKQTVLLVTHGGPLRIMICLAFGVDIYKSYDMAIDNTALSELTVTGRGTVLIRHNDTGHLLEMA